MILRYPISTGYYRRQTARHVTWMLFSVAGAVACFFYLLKAEAVIDYLLPVLGIVAFAAYIHRLFRHVSQGRAAYPEIELDNEAKTLTVVQGETRVQVDISHNLDLRLKYRSYHLEQIQLTTGAGEVLRLEGYDNMDDLGAELELLTPSHNVKRSKLRIR